MKKVLLMTCTAVMLFAAGSVCAAQQQAVVLNAVSAKEVKTEVIAVKESEARTVAQKEKKASCKVGSHESHSWIKARNKNCTNCGTQKDSQGKKVYYCYCDCAKAEQTKVQPDPKCPKGYTIAVNKETGKKSCECLGYVLQDKTCAPCPKNAVCNGGTGPKGVKCAKGYSAMVESTTLKTTCVVEGCAKNEFMHPSTHKCTACLANATCDGTHYTCKAGYQKENLNGVLGKVPNCVSITPTCKKDQYIVGNKCVACPAGATCDGKNPKCPNGYTKDKNGYITCNCAKNEFMHPSTHKCTTCLANATCDGTQYTCKPGYKKEENVAKGIAPRCISIAPTCKKDQYIVDNKCVACPERATCDGKNPKCPNGYTKDGNGYVICNCAKNEYAMGKSCVACPAGATCDGKNPHCPYGYTKDKKGYVICNKAPACKANQYMVNTTCTACPANATCDGKKATCKAGFNTSTKDGKVTCSAAKKCKQGSHVSVDTIKKQYKNCGSCGADDIKAGQCAKNNKAHKHYHCMCDC